MKYFFIPGRSENLSWKELNSVSNNFFKDYEYILKKEKGYYSLDIDKDISGLFSRLGGFVRYGIFLDGDLDVKSLTTSDKFTFGISSYSSRYGLREIQKLSKSIKEEFSKIDKKTRFVLPKGETFLNAAQVLKNNILEDGFELIIFQDKFAKTLGVQNIDSFYTRDYQKPFVDTGMGVLPVKLARMMINFAEIPSKGTIWDPFCGTGNILLEGLDLGYKVLGSDIDQDALKGAKDNIDWAKKTFDYQSDGNIFFFDVLHPSKSKIDLLKGNKIDGIVCEPYMGAAQRKVLEPVKAQGLANQHFDLVTALFQNLEQLKFEKNIKVVVIFPEYKTKGGWISVKRNSVRFKNAKLLECKDLHWSRRDSIIRRLIFIFDYNSR